MIKTLAKAAAKQIAREPLEILKKAGRQVVGIEQEAPRPATEATPRGAEISPQEKEKIEAQGQRQLAALEKELKDIRDLKEQRKSAGQSQGKVPVSQEKPLVEPTPKHSRRFLGIGQKSQAQKQQTRVEKPLPPSG